MVQAADGAGRTWFLSRRLEVVGSKQLRGRGTDSTSEVYHMEKQVAQQMTQGTRRKMPRIYLQPTPYGNRDYMIARKQPKW